MKKIFLITSFSLASILVSCGYEHTSLPGGTNSREGATGELPIGSSIDFATVKTQVFEPYCLRCHSAAGGNSGGVNLESHANVTRFLARIESAVTSGIMPPRNSLPDDRKAMLLSWIQAGAPETAGTVGTAPTTPGEQAPCDDGETDDDPKKGEDDCEDQQSQPNT